MSIDMGGFSKNTAWTQNPTATDGAVSILDFEDGFFEGSKIFRDKFPNHGWSGFGTAVITRAANTFYGKPCAYLDGTSRIMSPSASEFVFGAGDFTVEGWCYPTGFPSQSVVAKRQNSGIYAPFQMYFNVGTGALGVLASVTGGAWAVNLLGGAATLNGWNHYAMCRSGGTIYGYLNGVSIGSGAIAGSVYSNGEQVSLGANSDQSQPFTGWLGPHRFSNSAKYPGGSSFSPPTFFAGPDVR